MNSYFDRLETNPTVTASASSSSRSNMIKRLKKFLWTSHFWAVIGLLACCAGFYFQGVAGNGLGLWFLGLVFFGAAYLEQSH
jgi:hypothetical protein